MQKQKLKFKLKIITVCLLQAFFVVNLAWAGDIYYRDHQEMLAPRMNLSVNIFKDVYQNIVNEKLLPDSLDELADQFNNSAEQKLKQRNEATISQVINFLNYPNLADNPTLNIVRSFVLEFLTDPQGMRKWIGYHNENHVSDDLLGFLNWVRPGISFFNGDRSATLIIAAILAHDLGYFNKSEYIRVGHEKQSIQILKDFLQFLSQTYGIDLFTELEIEAIVHMIDMTELKVGKIKEANQEIDKEKLFDKEVENYTLVFKTLKMMNEDYTAINDENINLIIENDFIKNKFPSIKTKDLNDEKVRNLIIDTILGGEILGTADIYGQADGYLWGVAYLWQEFKEDLNRGDKTSPAAPTMFEQVGGSFGFHKFFAESVKLNKLKLVQPYIPQELKDKREAMLVYSQKINTSINNIKSGDWNKADINVLEGYINTAGKKFGFSYQILDQLRSEIDGFIQQGEINKAAVIQQADIQKGLEKTGFVDLLTDEDKDLLLKNIEIQEFRNDPENEDAGVIIKKGATYQDQDAYILLSGQVNVYGTYYYRVKDYKPGDVFGEMSPLKQIDRTATVRIPINHNKPARVMRIPGHILKTLYDRNLEIRDYFDGLMNTRIEELNKIAKIDEISQEAEPVIILDREVITETTTGYVERDEGLRAKYQNILNLANITKQLSTIWQKVARFNSGKKAQTITQNELNLVTGVLNSLNPLGQIISNGNKEDQKVVFKVPGIAKDGLGLKTLNDILGPELNDFIIQIRHAILQDLLKEHNLNYIVYNEDVFLIKAESKLTDTEFNTIKQEFQVILFNIINVSVNKIIELRDQTEIFDKKQDGRDIFYFLKDSIEENMKKNIAWDDVPADIKAYFKGNKEYYEKVQEYFTYFNWEAYFFNRGIKLLDSIRMIQEKLESKGIAISQMKNSPLEFGISTIKEETAEARLLADIEAHEAIVTSKVSGDAVYSDISFGQTLDKIHDLRTVLQENTEALEKEDGFFVLKSLVKDVLRNNIAWEDLSENIKVLFKDNENYFSIAQEYFSYLNLQDYIKKWPMDFKLARNRANTINDLLKKLDTADSGLINQSKVDILEQAKTYIEQEPKVPAYTSQYAYFQKGITTGKILITIDAVGFGLLNIKSFEKELQKIKVAFDQGDMDKVNRLRMKAADDITRKIVNTVGIIEDFIIKKLDIDKTKIASKLGGDEIDFIIDVDNLNQEELAHLLNVIKRYVKIEQDLDIRIVATQSIDKLREKHKNRTNGDHLAFAEVKTGTEPAIETLKGDEKAGNPNTVGVQDKDGYWNIFEDTSNGKNSKIDILNIPKVQGRYSDDDVLFLNFMEQSI